MSVNEGHSIKYIGYNNNTEVITRSRGILDLNTRFRDRILNSRKYSSFESFEDLEAKIEGLYNPQEIILNRILEELQNPDIKYHIFVDTK